MRNGSANFLLAKVGKYMRNQHEQTVTLKKRRAFPPKVPGWRWDCEYKGELEASSSHNSKRGEKRDQDWN